MTITSPTVKKLLTHYKNISLLSHTKATLDWDLNVNLPPKAAKGRAEQSGYLASLVTNMWLDKEFRKLLEQASTEKNLNAEEQAIVRNLNFGGKYYFKIPKDVIIKKDKVASEAFIAWREAREKNQFKKFQPYLEQLLELDREIAQYMGYKDNPYDALLDMFNPQLTAQEVEELFTKLRDELVILMKKITKSKNYTDSVAFINNEKQFPKPGQEHISKYLAQKMGYDLGAGRIDVSAHPFTTTLDRYDIRLTTAYHEEDFRASFSSTVHETGHALYEQGVNPNYSQTPLEHGVSLGIHEALSRFWENMVGRNPAFLHFATPLLQSHFPQLGSISEQDIIRSFNTVKPSPIRIEADEVTYSLHIIVRFEMENALINGKLSVKEAPEAWNEKYKKYVGITPKNDAEGILQDVHWSYGAFGYFPSYALGNLYGAQFLNTMRKDVKFEDELQNGNLLPIKQWLDTHIHQYGSMYFNKELVKKVTGKPLDYKYFVDYLNSKYSKLYNF